MSIKIEDLNHIYDPNTPYQLTALDCINLNIEDGEIVGLIGHTGSGKSTLIQHLNGLLRATSGRIQVGDVLITKDKKNLKTLRKHVGLVFQYPEYQLFEETVYKDIAFGPRNIGKTEEEIDSLVREAISHVGLNFDEVSQKAPFELSGGQKRKVAIAGVLAMNPDVLILDEPTAGLDPKSRDDLLKHIQRLHEEKNLTIIYVTHSMEEVARFAQRVVVMHKGKIVYDDTPVEVFKNVGELKAIGLDVPQMSKLVHLLNGQGFHIPSEIITMDALKEFLLKELRRNDA